MNSRLIVLCILVLTAFCIPVDVVRAQDDIAEHRSCSQCGMDRKAYGYSRMLLRFEDGGQVGVCSLNCAVIELDQNKKRAVKSLLVADRESHKLIDADKAFWVMGGNKRGVMTKRPKWAFAGKDASQAFIKAHGGTLATWDEVMRAAREDSASK